ncbi:MAG: SAM-dependent methyltransferase [Proteobacteria bacterium]|nr:SAM-dependent methyltransferase [Pseudomonadota bacterium]
MAFKYDDIVPWGRNFAEYRRMFDLSDDDLDLKILGCGDGPASFNFECNQRGGRVVSVDPIYHLTRKEIRNRIDETYDEVLTQTEKNRDKFVWRLIESVDALGKVRMDAMRLFLDAYEQGKEEKRYIPAALPDLPFGDNEFHIALSSHFLFLYTDNLSLDFHLEAVDEMLRVAEEVRIFPLLDVNARKSPYVDGVVTEFRSKRIEIRNVDYEFQIGGNEVLIIGNS